MEIEIVELEEISVIGKEGFCTKQKNIVQDLWQEANANFADVKDIGKKNSDGTYVGFWGAMSDETRSFLPWTEQFSKGYYLAGVQSDIDVSAPDGWTKWIIPARRYLCVEVSDNYHEVFTKVIKEVLPEKGLTLAGAVCDFTDPKTGKNKLFFPIGNC